MKTEHDLPLEDQLRLALTPAGEPDPALGERIRAAASRPGRRLARPGTIAAVAAVFLALATVAYALLDDTEHRRELSAEGELLHFCETEDTIYFTKWSMGSFNELICFADKATGVTAPLCGKPECDHTGSGCNAIVGESVLGLAVYDGHLYAANARGDIWRMDMDGTDHVLVRSGEADIVFADGGSGGQFWFHRGYAYHLAESTTVSGGVYTQGVKAYAVSLTDPEEEPVIILREQYPGKAMTSRFHLAGDSLYICVNLWDDPSKTEAGENELRIYRWDIEARTMETVYDEPAGPVSVQDMWAGPDGLLLAGSKGEHRGVYWLDFAAGQITERFALEKDQYGTTFAGDRIIVEGWDPQPEVLVCWVMDLDGNVLQQTRIDVPEEEPAEGDSTWDWWGSFIFGADGQHLYGALHHDRGDADEDSNMITDEQSVCFFQISMQTGEYRFIGQYETTREG